MEETLPIKAETGNVPSRHLLVCADVPILKYRAAASLSDMSSKTKESGLVFFTQYVIILWNCWLLQS